MGKLAFLFAGQGAQAPGMGQELAKISKSAASVFKMADRIRPGTSDQCFNATKEELCVTRNTQPCLFCVDLASAVALQERGIEPDFAAGFSLGELAALAFCGYMSHEDAFRYVVRRGEAMDDCGIKNGGTMFAVMGMAPEKVAEVASGLDRCYPVNYNSPGQTVVACSEATGETLPDVFALAGGKARRLAVSGAFHSPFMSDAAKILESEFSDIPFNINTTVPVYANFSAQPYTAREEMFRQVISPVRWQETIENLAALDVDTFVELGPGKTLTGLTKRILPDAWNLRVEDHETLAEALTAFNVQGEKYAV